MKNHLNALAAALVCLSLAPAYAQSGGRAGGMGLGGGPRGPEMGGAMIKVFGDNSAFSATLELQGGVPGQATMRGKMSCDNGKSRFEMDLSESAGGSPENAAQMKAMGMDKMVMISRPDKKVSCMVFPGLKGFVETPIQNADAIKPGSDFKVETTEVGKETVDGHPCVKNKVVVTDDQAKKHDYLVWNATDLKKFPVKIETTEEGRQTSMLFKDVKLAKPDASQFEPPSDFKKYADMMSLMMERMGGGTGMPPR